MSKSLAYFGMSGLCLLRIETNMNIFLKRIKARIRKGRVEVNLDDEGFKPIDYRRFHAYPRGATLIDTRLSRIELVKSYLGGAELRDFEITEAQCFIKTLQAEQETGLKYGDWVKFHRPDFNDTIEGFLEETRCGRLDDDVTSNIERTQFSGMNSWSNYVTKGAPLNEIKANLIEHIPCTLPRDVSALVLICKNQQLDLFPLGIQPSGLEFPIGKLYAF